MILRSLAVCGACLALWHAVLPALHGRHRASPGLQRQNVEKVERYAHETAADAVVIAGSSMADHLDGAVLGADHAKLTFPAGCALTGLEIVRRSDRVPRVCWIETNMILRGVDGKLAGAGGRAGLGEVSLMFRERGRPSGYAVGVARDGMTRFRAWFPGGEPGEGPDRELRERMIRESIARLDRTPSAHALAEALSRLALDIDQLSRAGCECVLFEMPVDARLRDLAEPSAVRAALRQRFPTNRYRWFFPERDGEWITTDGVHLGAEDARLVSEQMRACEQTLPPARAADGKRLVRRL